MPRGPGDGRTRRQALRAALGAAGALAASGGLAGCGHHLARLDRAVRRPLVLLWRPWLPPGAPHTSSESLLHAGIRPWLQANPGVEVRVVAYAHRADLTAAMVAGQGPDVFCDHLLPTFAQAGLVYDIGTYVRSFGVRLDAFAPALLRYLQSVSNAGGGSGRLYGLPAYTHTLAMAVNEGTLATLGLSRPQPDWTHVQWADLWQRAVSLTPGRHRYGGNLYWSGYDYSGGNPAPFYLRGFGGEYVDPADTARCQLAAPGSIAAMTWCDQLVRSGVAGGDTLTDLGSGRLVSGPLGTAGDLARAAELWQGVRWNLYPMPVWPKGRLTFASSAFYGVWSGSRYPEVAWSLVRYLCLEPAWQRWMMQVALLGPNQPGLWDEWLSRVLQVGASALRAIDLRVFVDAVQRDEAYVGESFRFAEARCASLIRGFGAQVRSGHRPLVQAAAQTSTAVDALQRRGLAREAQAKAALARLNGAKA